MILFFPSRNAPITRQVKRMLLAIYTRVGGLLSLCPGQSCVDLISLMCCQR